MCADAEFLGKEVSGHVKKLLMIELSTSELAETHVRLSCAAQLQALLALLSAVAAQVAAFASLSALNDELAALLPPLRHRLACLRCSLPFATPALALVEALCAREQWDEAALVAADAAPPLTRFAARLRAVHALCEGKYAEARELWRSLLTASKTADRDDARASSDKDDPRAREVRAVGNRYERDEEALKALLDTLRTSLKKARDALPPSEEKKKQLPDDSVLEDEMTVAPPASAKAASEAAQRYSALLAEVDVRLLCPVCVRA